MWYRNRKELPEGAVSPKEVVFEVITAPDDVGWGFAVVDIRRSEKHYHERTLETYTLVSGELRVHMDDEEEVLRTPGQVLTVPLNTPHWAESVSDTPARITVFSLPAWTPEDHVLV
jgi:mannose-6-phosphate isomerase-like protein (cupin superfamily)